MAVNRLKAPRNVRIDFAPSPRQYELWKLLQPNYLHRPYMGYRRIELVEKLQYTWLARICGSGKEIEVREDEFELD